MLRCDDRVLTLWRLRLILVFLVLAGCTSAPAPTPPAPPVQPTPRIVAEVPQVEAQPVQARVDTVEVCVLHQGKLANVRAERLATGDTVVGGRPFSAVYADTGQYALTREWYVNSESIDYDPENVCFVRYGLPRVVELDSVVRLGSWRGVPVFRERSNTGTPMVIYVPVRAGCELQPYQTEAIAPPPSCPKPEYQFRVP
ncbi:hypothetical protein [Longimicrobium sp.]|uniref:hypothetical protein n=1 Tax=Longimicrobium sp. TaxID=2029185 RepID=UPI003B3A5EB1